MDRPLEMVPPQRWHAMSAADVARELATSVERGLDEDEAARRLAIHGENALPEVRGRTWLGVFLAQFASPLIYLLLGAALVALLVGERTDAVVILSVVVVNAVMGAIQEGRAERSMEGLRRLAELHVRVRRGGADLTLPARRLVPGDLIVLAAGDAVGADARVARASGLEVSEAALTGESTTVRKDVDAVSAEAPLAERPGIVHSGTFVTAGRGEAFVVATGLGTEVGKIATLTERAVEPTSPLEWRLARLGRGIIVAAAALFALVMAIGILRGLPASEVLMVAISQVVGLIPEGLPVAMTIGFAIGMQRMAARGAIVRRLSAVETLGSVSVIGTDKTGTLTRNEMTVTAVALPGGRLVQATGIGYAPEGTLSEQGATIDAIDDPALARLLEGGVLCNDARLVRDGDGRWQAVGDPTEAALLVLAVKGGIASEAVRAAHPREAEVPFESAARMMATAHRGLRPRIVVKGAPETVLELAGSVRVGSDVVPMDPGPRAAVALRADELAGQALRVLAIAEADGCDLSGGLAGLRGRATFLGLVGELDPPRPEAAAAVAQCRSAGIRPIMLTGDHVTTALAIARQIGIADAGEGAVHGQEIDRLSDEELADLLRRVSVFARVEPAHKQRIVDALLSRGETVAMTGDGVNDAPALARADVGVAMGITGTEVAKQAARMVLTDDNFATIVHAVEEGRIVYRNLKKILLLLLSTSFAEVTVLLGALFVGLPLPFAAVQILWNNVVTEGLITVNLAMEPAEGDEMKRRPRPRHEPLVTRRMLRRMLLMTATIAAATLGFFAWHVVVLEEPFAHAQTSTFTLLAVLEWFNVLNCRSERRSAFSLGLHRNLWLLGGILLGNVLQFLVIFSPAMNRVFHTVPIPWHEALVIGVVGSSVLWVEEARKWLARRREAGEHSALAAVAH